MKVLDREEKMRCLISLLYEAWHREVSDMFCFCSMEESLSMDVPPYQQTKLLEILRDKYDCLTFKEEPCFKNREEVLNRALCMDVEEYADEFDLERDIKEALSEKKFIITVKDNFQDVYQRLVHKMDIVFKLRMSDTLQPILYINETPIRKFQSSESYPYKLMRLALGLPNGSMVPAKDVLKTNRGNRGCPQDLSDIFRSPVIKSVFVREITSSSFKIYHEITRESLNSIPYFQKRSSEKEPNTEYFAKMVEECRISP